MRFVDRPEVPQSNDLEGLEAKFLLAGGKAQLTLLALALLGLVEAARGRCPLLVTVFWAALYYGAMFVTKVPAFGWYFVPPLPVYYGLVGLAVASIVDRVRMSVPAARHVWSSERSAIAGLAVFALPLALHVRSVATDVGAAQRLEDEVRKPLGLWLEANTRSTDRILLEPIGYIGYFSRRRVLDLIGLVSPEVLPYYRRDVKSPLAEIVRNFRPEVLVLRESEFWEFERNAGAALRTEYRVRTPFPAPPARAVFYVVRREGGD